MNNIKYYESNFIDELGRRLSEEEVIKQTAEIHIKFNNKGELIKHINCLLNDVSVKITIFDMEVEE